VLVASRGDSAFPGGGGGNSRIIYVLDYFTIHGIKFNTKLFFEILFMDSIGMYNVYNNPPKKSFSLTNNFV
jgi:hypothetical protein